MGAPFSELLRREPSFINVGVRDFADALRAAGAAVIHVEWSPPAGGDPELAAILDALL
jgi:FdrA protein